MRPWQGVLAGAALAGCAETVAGGGLRGDGGPADATDAGGVTPGAPCSVAVTIDGNAAGRRFGRTTAVFVASSQWARGVSLPVSESCGPGASGDRQVVVRYVMQGDGWLTARVVVADAYERRDERFVGRLLLLDRCGAGAQRLACAGRVENSSGLFPLPRTLLSPRRYARGEAVYLAATGDAPDVTFLVSEADPLRALGATCDPFLVADRCAEGTTCVGSAAGACVPDGVEGARCRRSGDACEPGLACAFATREGYPGVCLHRAAPGERCSFAASCATRSCPASGQCPAAGALSGPCRAGAPRCDEGIACVSEGSVERCERSLADGARCSPRRREVSCARGSSCLAVGEVWRCVRDGANAGACRARAPRCDAGLVCGLRDSRCAPGPGPGALGEPCGGGVADEACAPGLRCVADRCVARLPPGAACDPMAPQEACAAGSSCAGPAGGGRCASDGAIEGRCRAGATPCDAGLACTASARCAPAAAVGALCDDGVGCARFERCELTCRATGADGGWCRPGAPPCDAGLTCVPGEVGSPSYCVRALAAGDRCNGGAQGREQCGDGLACLPLDTEGQTRCAPSVTAAVACSSDRGGPASCPVGAACEAGVCRPVVGPGAPCGPGVSCGPAATCGWPEDAGGVQCVARGSLGGACRTTGAPCDAPLGCVHDALGRGTCVAGGRAGAGCADAVNAGCADGLFCDGRVCVAEGSRGAPCRATGAPCDAGLACDGASCVAAIARGAACEEGACAEGLACATAGAAPAACGDGDYAMSVRQGAAFEDPCDLPIVEPATPFTLRYFGVPYGVRVSPAGEAWLSAPPRAEGGASVDVRLGDVPIVLDSPRDDGVCARITGAAPRRRLVFGGGGAGDGGSSLAPIYGWAVSFTEGSDAIEVRLRLAPGGSLVRRHVQVRLRAEGVVRYASAAVANVPGTAITLTPR
ncbi:MAG: hypothetical protein U0324_37240 [Polyangiales bacterium]